MCSMEHVFFSTFQICKLTCFCVFSTSKVSFLLVTGAILLVATSFLEINLVPSCTAVKITHIKATPHFFRKENGRNSLKKKKLNCDVFLLLADQLYLLQKSWTQ